MRAAIRIANNVFGILDGHFTGNRKGTSRLYWEKFSPNRFIRCVSSYVATHACKSEKRRKSVTSACLISSH